MSQLELITEIQKLKAEKDALLLAHTYQNDEIQEIADFVGDSLELSRLAAKSPHRVLVLCGVHFMAESAALLSPEKTVLLPAPEAGCPMADMADAETVKEWRAKYPRAAVVAYVNTSAAVKAVSDICCTSSNAVKVVRSLAEEEIIFLPDRNLGSYVASQVPEKKFHLWPGFCRTHHQVTVDEVEKVKRVHPEAKLLIHPECRPEVVAHADFVGSTKQIVEQVAKMDASTFIIGTEMGIIHGLKKRYPDKRFYLLTPKLVCPNMKKTTLADVAAALRTLQPVITVPEPIRSQARRCLERMLAVV
ncbi:MAG TPA: quinolinate synthase NadA [Firmicutes bacterium]|uniref:Quinolinate synthase n=1 Tax=Capillibacterium thermochitinicola TaxID=2699427 RepID=A0A8J6I2D0_9FIRM|nr:quinolinate synthase NadA [Capillibacterium thermochitinicola]MBA2133169.1 quinolinate synthase NadA [Capillibacterium thermochitinicola]HHW11712.1 quinolinate synthase NadA [Bacillota bacterium]